MDPNQIPPQLPIRPKYSYTFVTAIITAICLAITIIIIIVLALNHHSSTNFSNTAADGQSRLQPTEPGLGQCEADGIVGQIALSGGATCTDAQTVIQTADGSSYSTD